MLRNLAPGTGPAGAVAGAEVDQIRPRGCRAFPTYEPSDGPCAAARSPGPGTILSRFCRDSGLSRDKSPNSASYSPLREHTHAITNVREDSTIPQVPVDNWKVFNTFRTNAQIEGGALCMPPIPQ